jgi:hypothetical protein
MGDGRHHFTPTGCRQIGKDQVDHRPSHIGKSVAVEEQERGAAMALPQELDSLA